MVWPPRKKNMPSSNELKLLDIIAAKSAGTQRHLANASGFSLGLTNTILKKLASTGYIKIQNLNARKMLYMLTPKGIAEKSRRSYDYILNTIKTYHTCLNRIKSVINDEISAGKKHFIIIGTGNIADIVELAITELGRSDITFSRQNKNSALRPADNYTVLDCRLKSVSDDSGNIGISMLSKLLEGATP